MQLRSSCTQSAHGAEPCASHSQAGCTGHQQPTSTVTSLAASLAGCLNRSYKQEASPVMCSTPCCPALTAITPGPQHGRSAQSLLLLACAPAQRMASTRLTPCPPRSHRKGTPLCAARLRTVCCLWTCCVQRETKGSALPTISAFCSPRASTTSTTSRPSCLRMRHQVQGSGFRGLGLSHNPHHHQQALVPAHAAPGKGVQGLGGLGLSLHNPHHHQRALVPAHAAWVSMHLRTALDSCPCRHIRLCGSSCGSQLLPARCRVLGCRHAQLADGWPSRWVERKKLSCPWDGQRPPAPSDPGYPHICARLAPPDPGQPHM